MVNLKLNCYYITCAGKNGFSELCSILFTDFHSSEYRWLSACSAHLENSCFSCPVQTCIYHICLKRKREKKAKRIVKQFS